MSSIKFDMKTLSIDIETYSDIEIKLGVYRYCDTPSFTILLFAYSIDDKPIEIVDLASGDELPDEILEALTDSKVIKKAFNAQFERICIGKFLKTELDPSQWWCTMIHAAMLGLPGRLVDVAKILGLEEQKDAAGTHLINYFSKPCRPTRSNLMRIRNLPRHDEDKWELFKRYCKQDAATEKAVAAYLEKYPAPKQEMDLYHTDQKINDLGIKVDMGMVNTILDYYNTHAEEIMQSSMKITGLENPNSRDQLLAWLQAEGLEIEDLKKATLEEVLNCSLDDKVRAVIENRLETGMASIKKYQMLHDATCEDEVIRGTLQFYGANRTGRFAGRLVQVQNLPRITYKEIGSIRDLIKMKDFETLETLYDDSMSSIFSQLVRTTFTAREGYTYAIADYSAIEARVIAWLADETWVLDTFKKGGDVYKQTAAKMFNKTYEEIDKPLRQRGKVAVLALGYGGSSAAMTAMGALRLGILEDELPVIVRSWRRANPKIVSLWREVESLAIEAVNEYSHSELHHGVQFRRDKDFLFIRLPGGRELAYLKPKMKDGKFSSQIEYLGKESGKQVFGHNRTYGGKLVENIVQAIARDCLCEALIKLDKEGYRVAFHVHDEVIVEVPEDKAEHHLAKIQKIMGEPISWAKGLLLTAAGFTSKYYTKD